MIHRRLPIVGICVCVLSSVAAAQRESARRPDALSSRTPQPLQGITLTADQKTKIDALAQKYGPSIAKADQEAARTPQQLKERTDALSKAVSEGVKGAAAMNRIAAAGRLTADQVDASKRAQKLRDEREVAIMEVLTPEQRESLHEAEPEERRRQASVIIRLSPQLPAPADDAKNLYDVARELKLDGLKAVLDRYRIVDSKRAIQLPSQRVVVNNRPDRESQLRRRLQTYWKIDAVNQPNDLDALIKQLNSLKEIDTAYREFSFTQPMVEPDDDVFSSKQGYLDPAPAGIDARYAWTICNGEGDGVGLLDIERGWHEGHEDLPNPQLIYGIERAASQRHGTAVLGEVAGVDNEVGVVGVAPSASYIAMASYHEVAEDWDASLAQTLVTIIDLMPAGDVLLLEVQEKDQGLPAEVDDAVFDAVQLAVVKGIVVVAAAGNGNEDLDAYSSPDGKKIFLRGDSDFRDSGAILVGASDPKDSHNRAGFSNYGTRVDCFAWGRHVVTTGFNGNLDNGGGDVNKRYTKSFNGTSAAAPIVAGAAMILQGMSKGNGQTLLSPQQLRTLLANPSTGTAQGAGVSGPIGVMPDLREIILDNAAFCRPTPCCRRR